MSRVSTAPSLRGRIARAYSSDEMSLVRSQLGQSPLVIESDVWIGDGVVIMPGVRIGVGAVIAANAVITKDVPAYEIHGGVPAKKIGDRFPSALAMRLRESCWWECSRDYLNSLPLSNIFEFLERFEYRPVELPTFKIIM